jgi:hypothetical protein
MIGPLFKCAHIMFIISIVNCNFQENGPLSFVIRNNL